MRATIMYGAGDVRIEQVPDSVIKLPTDALVRVTGACICGSDLWPYASRTPDDAPARMGHEFAGVVEDTGPEVTTVKKGDLVVSPFAISDGTCRFCREGLQTSCAHPQAAFWDMIADEGGQAEAVRVPLKAVGTMAAYQQATGIVRHGGLLSRVGVPQYEEAPVGEGSLFRHNLRLAGGPAPVRAYITELMPDILDGTIEPGKVFDLTTGLDGVPDGYRDMADRSALKVLIKP